MALPMLSGFSAFAATASMKIYAIHIYGTQTTDDDAEGNETETEYGDAVLLESNGHYMLIDAGAEYAKDSVKAYLDKFFTSKGLTTQSQRHLDIYISHLHSDHIGGLKTLSEWYTIDRLYLPDYNTIGTAYRNSGGFDIETITDSVIRNRALLTGLDDPTVTYLKKGSTFTVGDVTAKVLGPVNPGSYTPTQFGGNNKAQQSHYLNNCSLTTMFTCGNVKFLTTGDIEKEEEAKLVSAYGASGLNADILKMPHHGLTSTSNTESFLKAVTPSYAFACNMGYETTETDDGKLVPKNYKAIDREQLYGIPYMVGTETKSLILDVASNKTTLYRDSDNNAVAASGEKLTGWVTVSGNAAKSKTNFTGSNKYYIDSNGKTLTGVQKIGGKYYYLGAGGAMESGNYESGSYSGYRKYENDTQLRYFYAPDSNGLTAMAVGFVKLVSDTDGKTYTFYYKDNGYRYKGSKNWSLVTMNGNTYAINDNGVVRTNGWIEVKESGKVVNYRYFNGSGVMQKGWLTDGGKKYYLDGSGLRYLGLKVLDGKTYYFVEENAAGYIWTQGWKGFGDNYRYFGTDGVMKTGWLKDGGKKYYLDSKGLRTVGLKEIDGETYYFVETNNAGYAWTEGWKGFGKNYRYFNEDGTMAKGWLKDGGKKYYLDKETGYRTVGFKTIGKKTYYFVETNKAGYVYKGGWKNFKVNKKTKAAYCDKKTGEVYTGWKKISGAKYYFDPETYFRATGLTEIDGAYYYFNDTGKLKAGKPITIDGVKCKFNKDGKMTSPTVKKVKSVKAKAKSKKTNLVTWKKNSKAEGYIVSRATEKNGEYTVIKTIKDNKTVQFTDKKAKSKTAYFYKVEAYRTIGGTKVKSAGVIAKKVKTK
jgi:glucan-binding YG repeat protein/beta-lactamase superfamily II metal-dependent hydrolase